MDGSGRCSGGDRAELSLDGDAARSVRLQGLAYRLQPVIRVAAQATSGSISGAVLPAAARAHVWTVAGPDPVSALADTTTSFFTLMVLPTGIYQIHVDHTGGSYLDIVLPGVVVVEQQNTNHGTITLNGSAGVSAGCMPSRPTDAAPRSTEGAIEPSVDLVVYPAGRRARFSNSCKFPEISSS